MAGLRASPPWNLLSLVSDEQRQLQSAVEQLCRGALGDLERRAGETDVLDRGIVAGVSEAGLLDWAVPGPFGTARHRLRAPEAMSLTSFCLIRETLARFCPNAELVFTMQGLGAGPICTAWNSAIARPNA
jgi:acyl-CoA dehydrogenase